jgi:uncharacterized integral membrane protein
MRRSFDIFTPTGAAIARLDSCGGANLTMKKLIAAVFALFALMAIPAVAQQVEFDIFDKSDFTQQLATNKPVIVHVNTTW